MIVSIIIPFFNASSTIERCIKSAISQTYKNIEIVCIDNNSEDSSVQILQKFLNSYDNISLYTELRRGANFARNLGIKKASGSWLNFLDADDFISERKIENQIRALNDTKKYHFIVSPYFHVSINGEDKKHFIKYPDTWKNLFSGNLGVTSSNLYKKKSIIEIGMWNEDYNSSQEAELMFKIIKKYGSPLLMKNEFQTIKYEQKSSISNLNKKNNLKTILTLRILIIKYLEEFKPKYFQKEKGWFLNELLTIILKYFRYDKNYSSGVYKQYLIKSLSFYELSTFKRKVLIFLIKIFGFNFGAFLFSKVDND